MLHSLQKFKIGIASSVVTQQNSDLASLGTDQVLDLFSHSDDTSATVAPKSTKAVGQAALLAGLGDLQTDAEYGDLDLASFTSSIGV